MSKIEVYDWANPESTNENMSERQVSSVKQFLDDLLWLENRGISIKKFYYHSEPDLFKKFSHIQNTLALQDLSQDLFPIIVVDEHIVSTQKYPTCQELLRFCNIYVSNTEDLSEIDKFLF